jgi:L-threonylcarbamoyladenylate synthase
MATEILKVEPTAPDPDVIARAADVIRRGGLVAFPTETVYGLGANALDAGAVARIFDAKGRPGYNPLIVHVADADAARELVTDWPDAAELAARAFWPGPLTLVLPRVPAVPDLVTGGRATVALRVPAHPVALALIRQAGMPIAAPSANPSTRVSPTTAAHVIGALGDRIDLVLDGGATPYGIESTVIDLTGERPRVLRPGVIGLHELEPVLGSVDAATLAGSPASDGSPMPSPGMADRHYSPAGDVTVFENRAAAQELVADARRRGKRVGALLMHPLGVEADEVMPLPLEPHAYARLLYAALHTMDAAGCAVILIEQVPDMPAWAAIRDRIGRAAQASG